MVFERKEASWVSESVINEAKKIKVTWRVWPEGMKPRHYKDLNGMAKDFAPEQLAGASISMVIGASIITTLNTGAVEKLMDEIF